MDTNTFNCILCGKPLRGRSEKKFCNLYCKNVFNNEKRAEENAEIGRIRMILHKNRRILKMLAGEKEARRVAGRAFRENGYVFEYYTHHYRTRDGKVYTICFDYGFMEAGDDWYVVVRKQAQQEG